MVEIIKKQKRFKKGEKHLVTYQSLLRPEAKDITFVKEEKDTEEKLAGLKKGFCRRNGIFTKKRVPSLSNLIIESFQCRKY